MPRRSADRVPATPIPPALDLSVFRQMADMSTDAFYLTDREGRFLYVNDRAATMGGYGRAELLRMTVSDINPEYPAERFDHFVASMGTGPLPPFETVTRRKDGTLVPIELSVARIEVDGAPYLFGVVRDISERKQLDATRKSFAQRMLQTLEAERQRVARELHDDVGQSVATVGVLLHALEQTRGALSDEMRPAVAAMQATIRSIAESVAHIVRDYHPAGLLDGGFEDTVRTHALQFTQRHNLALQLATVPVAGLLTREQELHLYRIVQEALANVARHAQARRVTVRLARRGAQLMVTVRDDGHGFDPRSTGANGFGLVTMRERAELLGAELSVRSRAGGGTEVRVVVSLRAAPPVSQRPSRPRRPKAPSRPPRPARTSRRRGPLTLV